jgi:hypothetical protein
VIIITGAPIVTPKIYYNQRSNNNYQVVRSKGGSLYPGPDEFGVFGIGQHRI